MMNLVADFEQFSHVPPIHANEMNRTVSTVPCYESKTLCQERNKLEFVHLARRHLEVRMSNSALATGVAIDPNGIVTRNCQNEAEAISIKA
jgi:hypothetical protein